MRTKERRRLIRCCSKEGRNNHRALTQDGVRTVPRLQVSQKNHLTPLQTTSWTSFYTRVKMCWPLLFFVDVIIHCKIYFVFFFLFSWFAQTMKIFFTMKISRSAVYNIHVHVSVPWTICTYWRVCDLWHRDEWNGGTIPLIQSALKFPNRTFGLWTLFHAHMYDKQLLIGQTRNWVWPYIWCVQDARKVVVHVHWICYRSIHTGHKLLEYYRPIVVSRLSPSHIFQMHLWRSKKMTLKHLCWWCTCSFLKWWLIAPPGNPAYISWHKYVNKATLFPSFWYFSHTWVEKCIGY